MGRVHLTCVVVLMSLLPVMMSCTPVKFNSITQRPESYGGGYVVVGECCDGPNCEPCFWLCSPAIGGKYACGQIPWEDWT